jgi:hypothetical protein
LANDAQEREALGRLLLRYLIDHPAAADSIAGVRSWWLRGRIVNPRDLQIVLDEYLNKGWLVARGDHPETRIYSLNDREREAVERFVAGEGRQDG